MTAERREHERYRRHLDARIRFRGAGSVHRDDRQYRAVTRDISQGGMFLELLEEPLGGGRNTAAGNFILFRSTIEVEIVLPPARTPVRFSGKTAWLQKDAVPGQPRGLAIQFTEVDDGTRQALKHFLALCSETLAAAG